MRSTFDPLAGYLPHLPPTPSVMAPMAASALAVVAVTALAAATATTITGAPAARDGGGVGSGAASTARMMADLTDAKVITLTEDCGSDCQASVSDALTARGCSRVAVLPTLRMVTAACAKSDGASADAVNAEAARIPGVLQVEDDSIVTGTQVDAEDREGDRTFSVVNVLMV